MGKNTFGKMMPRALSENLKIMGEQIMLARKRRHFSMQDIADELGIPRNEAYELALAAREQ